jgi:sialic acid synthase SpsE
MPNIWEKINGNPSTSSGNKRVFVIAEIGKNFIQTKEEKSVEEYLENAKKLVDAAAASGADAVKFQTHNVEDEQLNIDITSPHFKGVDRYSWVKRNSEATPVDKFWKPLKKYCDERRIIFFSTPMSRGAAKILNEEVGMDLWKIGSGDILDFVMLDYLRQTGKPIIISSGMSTLEEVGKAISFLKRDSSVYLPQAAPKATRAALRMTEKIPRPSATPFRKGGIEIAASKTPRNDGIILLHCVSKYPCPVEDLRLGTMEILEKKFGLPIGFSDHSIGIESSLVAVAMGAKVIEKHFSLSREFWGSDHKVSMTPAELKQMVEGIRKIENDPAERERVLGTEFAGRAIGKIPRSDNYRTTPFKKGGIEIVPISSRILDKVGTASKTPRNDESVKVLQEGEAVFRPLFRKSLMAARDIKAGEVITAEMLYAMRPQQYANGLPSEQYEDVIGKKISRDLKKFEPITWEVI